jgi:hypothetical protein
VVVNVPFSGSRDLRRHSERRTKTVSNFSVEACRQGRELPTNECRGSVRQAGLRELAADHPVVKGIPPTMGGEMDVEVGNPVPEHVEVHHVCTTDLPEHPRHEREHRPQRSGFLPPKVRDVGDVALRFEIAETDDFSFGGDAQPPAIILPDLLPTKFGVTGAAATEDARGCSLVHAPCSLRAG